MGSFIEEEIVKVCKLLYEKNYNGAYGGNISCREGDKIYITPTRKHKGFIEVDDIVVTDLEGNVLKGKHKPSSEAGAHYKIYKYRNDIGAVIHAHPIFVISLSVSHIPLNLKIVREAFAYLGNVKLIPYSVPESNEFSSSVAEALTDADACIIENHGATVVGNDLMDAFSKLELLERTSMSFIFSKLLGAVEILSEAELKSFFKK